jgi:hypothetical protein
LLDLLDEPGKIFAYDSYNHAFSAKLIDFAAAYGPSVILKFLTKVWKQEQKLVRTCQPGDNCHVLIVMHGPVAKRDCPRLLSSFGSIFKQVIYETYLPKDLDLVEKRWIYVKSDYSRSIDLELSHFETISQADIAELMQEANGRPGVESVGLSGNKVDCITAKFYNPISPEHLNLTEGMLTSKIYLLLKSKHDALAATS